MTGAPVTVVVTDASVLINLIITDRLALLAELAGYRFMVPDVVVEEIRRPEQRQVVDATLANGVLSPCTVEAVGVAELLLELGDVLGSGELACLALAAAHGWTIACDEKKRFRREALHRIGADRLLGTVEIYLLLLGQGHITAADADADKSLLATHRFTMSFGSFRDHFPEQ